MRKRRREEEEEKVEEEKKEQEEDKITTAIQFSIAMQQGCTCRPRQLFLSTKQ